MNYLINSSLLPKGNRWLALFWSQPSAIGLFNANEGEILTITTNQSYHLGLILPAYSENLFVIEAGGFSPQVACSLSTISIEKFSSQLDNLNKENEIRYLNVPTSIASYMKWVDGQKISGMQLRIISNDPLEWGLEGIKRKKYDISNNTEFVRIFSILRLLLGQIFIMSIPLSIFGIKSLGLGYSILLSVSLLFIIFGKFLPMRRSLISGCIISLALIAALTVICRFVFIVDWKLLFTLDLGILISGLWLDIVLNGAKP